MTAHIKPIDMLLFCPKCHKQHVDAPEKSEWVDDSDPLAAMAQVLDTKEVWDNPPHKSHLCHACGTIWRPADVPTNGVFNINTKGKDDNWLFEGCGDKNAIPV